MVVTWAAEQKVVGSNPAYMVCTARNVECRTPHLSVSLGCRCCIGSVRCCIRSVRYVARGLWGVALGLCCV